MSVSEAIMGGPLFDDEGNLVAMMASRLIGDENEKGSFAIPAYLITSLLNITFITTKSAVKNPIVQPQPAFTQKHNPLNLKIKAPVLLVTDKTDCFEASVIVKTKSGFGSGFAINNEGYIITAYHVVKPDSEKANGDNDITIITSDGEEIHGVAVRGSEIADLALIRTNKPFKKAFRCPDTKTFKIMQKIYTVGGSISLTFNQSVSSGIISNERVFHKMPMLQMNMSVNKGISGGPLFDDEGNLHGVMISKLMGKNTEGVSFAVPAYLIARYLNIVFIQ